MKTYHTSLKNAALLFAALFSFLVCNAATAQNCGFRTDPQITDSVGNPLTMSFSADPKGSQIHEILITNTSNASLTLNFSLKYSTDAGVTWTLIQIPGFIGDVFTIDRLAATFADTISIYPVFNAGAQKGKVPFLGILTISNPAAQCQRSINLTGTLIIPPANVTIGPDFENLGPVFPGADSCGGVSVTNNTAGNVTITGVAFKNQVTDFTMSPPFTSNIILQPGGIYNAKVCYNADTITIHDSNEILVTVLANGAVQTLQASFSGQTVHKIITPPPPICLETQLDPSYKDALIIGTSADRTIHLLNTTNHDIIVTNIEMVDSESIGFKFTSALPVTVPAHSSDKSLNYTFSALSDFGGRFIDYGHATLDLTGDSVQCSTVGTYLIGNVAKPGGGSGYDTTIRPLFPSDQRNLTFAGNGKPVTIRFTFTNNLNVDCTVNGITLQNGTFFTITMTNPTPTPFVVHPGGDVDVWIIYNAKDKLIHTDSLIIDATHNLQSVIFTLQGVQSVSAEVPVESSEPVVETTPNPASGMITVQGIPDNVQSISIMNVLGEVVMQPPVPHSASSTLNVSALPPGIYYLRMIYPAGVTSKKIVKE